MKFRSLIVAALLLCPWFTKAAGPDPILRFGNPLLDFIAEGDQEFLKDLLLNSQKRKLVSSWTTG